MVILYKHCYLVLTSVFDYSAFVFLFTYVFFSLPYFLPLVLSKQLSSINNNKDRKNWYTIAACTLYTYAHSHMYAEFLGPDNAQLPVHAHM